MRIIFSHISQVLAVIVLRHGVGGIIILEALVLLGSASDPWLFLGGSLADGRRSSPVSAYAIAGVMISLTCWL